MKFYIIIAILFISNLIFIIKYFKIKKEIKKYFEIGTGRNGFYLHKHWGYVEKNSYVFIKEIDRYSNGYSEIIIDKIEPLRAEYSIESNRDAKNKFVTLKLTKDIEWLEGEEHLKKIRREKFKGQI